MTGSEISFYDLTKLIFFSVAQQPHVGQSPLIHEVSRSHSTTHHIR